MKKAVVIGGSNGIGLAIVNQFIEKRYYVEILDRSEGDLSKLPANKYHYTFCDLMDFDEEILSSFAMDKDVKALMVTAGIGRIADFQAHHIAEIDKILTIDLVSTAKTIRLFYDRLLSKEAFYAGVMGSISGWMSSPAASVYASAKAGIVRLLESVKIE